MFSSKRFKVLLSLCFVFIVGAIATGAIAQEATPAYTDPCSSPDATATASVTQAAASDKSFTIILPGPRGDRSFVDGAASGAERAIAELGVKGTIVEPKDATEHDAAIRRALRDKPDLLIMIAVDGSEVTEIADEFPDQHFAAQETFFPATPTEQNLALYNIYTHENSYLAGIAAGMLTRTKTVGAVGGLDIDGINLFIVGYEEGVKSVCADCKLVRSYVGGFSDPVTAKEQALNLYSQGADILYQVAGRSGEGVLDAAKETGNFAIGVDTNQDDLYPGTIIVSAMKRVDNAVFAFVQNMANDKFEPGLTKVGLKEGFAGLSWDVGVCSRTFDKNGPADMVAKLPAVREAIDKARAGILDGSIVVDNVLDNPIKK